MREGLVLGLKTILTLVGVLLLLAGALEIGVLLVAPEQDPSLVKGFLLLAAGGVLAGWPLTQGTREMLEAIRRKKAEEAALRGR